MKKHWLLLLTISIFYNCHSSPKTNQELKPTTIADDQQDTIPYEVIDPETTLIPEEVADTLSPTEETTPKEKPPAPSKPSKEPAQSLPDTPKEEAPKAAEPDPSQNKQEELKNPPTTTAPSQAPKPELKPPAKEEKEILPESRPFSHAPFDALLQTYVSANGLVNYAGFKKDQVKLETYLQELSENPPQNKSRNEQIAYWINAYNAFTIDLILDNYPTTSILKLDDGNPWDVKSISIGGKLYSLNEIEKTVLLKVLREPRVHFAVNCAAQSCPPLRNRAWQASSLQRDLEAATKAFINNPKFNTIEKKKAALSKIFEWYANDFGSVIDFVNQYSTTQLSAKAKISYLEYDWSLNQ